MTRLDLYTVPVHDIWYHVFGLDFKNYKEFLTALVQVQKNLATDNKSSFNIIVGGGLWRVALTYQGKSSGLPAAFKPLEPFLPPKNQSAAGPTNGTVYSLGQAISPPEPAIA